MAVAIPGEFADELYQLVDKGFFDLCLGGHDELEDQFIRWAKKDYRAIVEDENESSNKIENRIRETEEQFFADFLSELSNELLGEALDLLEEALKGFDQSESIMEKISEFREQL